MALESGLFGTLRKPAVNKRKAPTAKVRRTVGKQKILINSSNSRPTPKKSCDDIHRGRAPNELWGKKKTHPKGGGPSKPEKGRVVQGVRNSKPIQGEDEKNFKRHSETSSEKGRREETLLRGEGGSERLCSMIA